ncbi:hypothetical protein J2I47_02070 [Fibrella sp. HMF5335]|uniref:Lipoprotein n=1 Tax=Fibrella rubiginis TaxID=2817060 RepID=A0A939GBI2_9BACT|nr:hypothetical protein [Fibrella rubiginis]MBO0935326.1 hypothetical protein [Fibrella rubiginis]
MHYSHNLSVALFIAALPLAYACKSSEVAPTNRVTLEAYQSARLQNDVTVRVDSLLDSRCPQGVACIWEGNVVVKATLSKSADKQQVRLVLGTDFSNGAGKKPDSTGVVLSGATYSVLLRDVTPYPDVNKPSQIPKAVIDVSLR